MDADDIVSLHRWLSIPRVAASVVGLAAIIGYWYFQPSVFDPRPFFYFLIPEYVLTSMLLSRLIIRKVRQTALLNLQIVLDLAAVTFVVAYTGGVKSPFVLLFLLVIISASLLSGRALVGVGVAAAVIYETMSVAEHAGLFPLIRRATFSYQQQDAVTLVVIGLIAALIAFQSTYFLSRIREKDEEILKLKDEFIFRTVHDLRSPSTVIRFIAAKYGAAPDRELRKDIGRVNAALDRMSLLIDDLLKMATGSRPDFVVHADRVDLSSIIRSASEELAPAMENRRVRFTYAPSESLPQVIGDVEKFKEIFSNLLDNAVKYNREGGSIAVTHGHDGHSLATSVTDTGVGISIENQKKLFAPFFRGDVGIDVRGTGLGLYMTKKLIEKMRGRIEVSSAPGVGTTFTVYFPIAE
jgi:signal transduction histidine kinase